MARDRVYINSDYRKLIEVMKDKDIVGFNLVENKESFLLAVALGLDSPKTLNNRDGWFLMKNLKTVDKAILASVLLGKANDDSEVDLYADLEKAIDLCEEYAEAGFEKMQRLVVEANCDNEVIERNLIEELDRLYKVNVEEKL